MSREAHVTFCERPKVRFLRSTLLVILVSYHRRADWLLEAVKYRMMQELDKLGVSLNTDKTKIVNLRIKRKKFVFLGFIFQQRDYARPEAGHFKLPKPGARKALLGKLKRIFRSLRSRRGAANIRPKADTSEI